MAEEAEHRAAEGVPLPGAALLLGPGTELQPAGQVGTWSLPGEGLPPTHLPPIFVLLGLGTELQPTGQVGTWSLPGEGPPPFLVFVLLGLGTELHLLLLV